MAILFLCANLVEGIKRNIYECEMIFKFGPLVQEMWLKIFNLLALIAILFNGVEPFVQFIRGHYLLGTFMRNYSKLGPVVQEMLLLF